MFDFDFEDMPEPEPGTAETEVPAAAETLPAFALPRQRAFVGDLQVEVATLGGGVVASLKLPVATTAVELKERLEKLLGVRAAEQRLAAGPKIFQGVERLSDVAPATGNLLQISLVHVPGARSVAVSGSRDGSLRLWDLDRGTAFLELPCQSGQSVSCLATATGPRRAVTGGNEGLLQIWDLEGGKAKRALRGHRVGVTCLAVDWANEVAMSGDEEGALLHWDLAKGTIVQRFPGHDASVLCVSFDLEANGALSGGADYMLRFWAIESGDLFLEFPGHTPVNCLSANLARPPLSAVVGNFAIIKVWSLTHFSFHWDIPVHTAAVTCLCVEWQSMRLVSGSADSTLIVGRINLNVNKVDSPKVLRGHSGPVSCLDVDWSRMRALSGSEDGQLRFWDLDRGSCLQELTGHRGGVVCLALQLDVAPPSQQQSDQPEAPRSEADELECARRDAGVAGRAELGDLAQGRLVQASSSKDPGRSPKQAVDGDARTRWTSDYADNQWLMVDLGASRELSHVEIRWEAAYAETYTLHKSNNAITWTTVATERGREGWVVTRLPPQTTARWVRMFGQKRATKFGFSIWEFRVCGVMT